MLKFDDVEFAAEGLCKILPLISTFLKHFDLFSQLKPTTPRIKYLMMDALDSIAKEPCKGTIMKKSTFGLQIGYRFLKKKFGSSFNKEIDYF